MKVEGSNVNETNDDGETARDLAIKRRNALDYNDPDYNNHFSVYD